MEATKKYVVLVIKRATAVEVAKKKLKGATKQINSKTN
jgi:hypothetical protein